MRELAQNNYCDEAQKFNPNFTYEKQKKTFEPASLRQKPEQEKPTPMDIDPTMSPLNLATKDKFPNNPETSVYPWRETSYRQKITLISRKFKEM